MPSAAASGAMERSEAPSVVRDPLRSAQHSQRTALVAGIFQAGTNRLLRADEAGNLILRKTHLGAGVVDHLGHFEVGAGCGDAGLDG